MTDHLHMVLDALENGKPTLVRGTGVAELMSDFKMTLGHLPAISALQEIVRKEIEINLEVVGAVYGCTKLFISAKGSSEAECRRLLEELFNSELFARAAVDAGFSALQIHDPHAYKTLTTGKMVGEVPNNGLPAFVSYARKDEKHRIALSSHLSALVKQKLLRTWSDRSLSPGQEWADGIDEALAEARLIICLVSPDFIASQYCWDVELPYAMSRHEAGVARTVPVIVRPVDWEETTLGRLHALPSGAKPITTWGNRDMAWTDVAKNLRRVIRELRQA